MSAPWFKDENDTIYVKGPYQGHIPYSRWSILIKYGCAKCGHKLEKDEALKIRWISEAPFCPTCAQNNLAGIDMDSAINRTNILQ